MRTVFVPRAIALLFAVAPLSLARRVLAQTGESVRVRLRADTVISGVRCAPTGRAYAVIHPNGSLDECPLAADTVIGGHALPRGTWLRLREDRSLDGVWLPHDVELQRVPCKGTGYKGWSVRFAADVRLASCYLAHDAVIDSVPCRGAAFLTELRGSSQVTLYANGRLASCRAARSFSLNGRQYRVGDRIVLDDKDESAL